MLYWQLVALGFGASLRRIGVDNVLNKDKTVANISQTFGRLLFADTNHLKALFANAVGKGGKITVGADQDKPIETASVHDVHRIDDQTNVTGIFTLGICAFLLGRQACLTSAPAGQI